MKISNVAMWVEDLEKMRDFFEHYFDTINGKKYSNPLKGYESYMLSFDDGARLELMKKIEKPDSSGEPYVREAAGFTHIAISVGSEAGVDRLTLHMAGRGVTIVSAPRWTGDGYYVSEVLDPEGNSLEITV